MLNLTNENKVMITEDYCSYEVAKLLKEKGFDYQGFDYIDFEGEVIRQDRPTHQMAMKWLREKYNINISIFPTIETDMIVREDYNYAIYKNKTVVYQSCSTSYEDAIESALNYTLKNLI